MSQQLFLLHFAGGNRYSYEFIKPFLNKFSLIVLELPGRGDRIDEALIYNIEEAVEDIYNQVLNELDGSKFSIYGHSLGAILAYLVTIRLEKSHKYPAHLFLSGKDPVEVRKKRHLLNKEDLLRELIKLDGLPAEVANNEDFINFFLPIVRADFEAAESKIDFTSKVNSPIYAMMGKEEEGADQIALWVDCTNSDFHFQIFDGGHFFIHHYPEEISRIIADKIGDG
ncbi:thioesterase domain-containing protein [Croceitalea sp. MTPC5]|uniref:thioesterase II family protein n=1 Tax=Croceitalea sp. MTPC5 TaxID=3056565 RepID=UPI002B3EE593|nr:thioesterase domain-containing protein [Croceitalea sp. MTPC5]